MSSCTLENPPRPSGDRILALLKTRGPQTAGDLGAAAGVSHEAARQQLARLATEGLVAAVKENRGVGRPVQLWHLTDRGHARFPDGHAELTAQLLRAVRAELGEAALLRLIDVRSNESRACYATALKGVKSLRDRVATLAALRSREGYMAESRRDGAGYLLIENHCPICVAATACQGFCASELDTFRAALGPGVCVERTEHVVQGDRRCVYRISPVRKKPT